MKKLNITIIGGSNSAHTIIPLLSNSRHTVRLLTNRPQKWDTEIAMHYTAPDGKTISVLKGELTNASNEPSKVIPNADVILLSLPVSRYREVLNKIAPYINVEKKIYIGTIYGQAGFNWMVNEIRKRYMLNNIVTFAAGLIPWITRTLEYGKSGINYGPKKVNVVAVEPQNEYKFLNEYLLNALCYDYFKTGKFYLSDNFISLTLSVDNQIIHLSRLYGLYIKYGGEWTNKLKVPMFYKDYDDLSTELLRELDLDYSKIRKRLKNMYPNKDFKYMLNYLDLERLSYGSTSSNIKESFTESKTLGQIPTPTIKNKNGLWVFDKTHRFFTDDLYYGLIIAKWFGEKLHIQTETIDKIIYWAQDYIGDRLLEGGKLDIPQKDLINFKYGLPSSYGYNSIEEVVD